MWDSGAVSGRREQAATEDFTEDVTEDFAEDFTSLFPKQEGRNVA